MAAEREVINTGVPNWYMTFADISTLMLTFFVLLLSFANMDVVAFREMLGSVQGAFGVVIEKEGDPSPFVSVEEEETVKEESEKKGGDSSSPQEKKKQEDSIEQMKEAVSNTKLGDNVTIFVKKPNIVIRVDGGSFFASGSAKFKKDSIVLLKGIVDVMKRTDYTLTIEGHTDSVPIKSKRYPSNWELSGVRATTVLRYMVFKKVDVDRLSAIGYADTRPIMDNESKEGRAKNRRVEFILSPNADAKKE